MRSTICVTLFTRWPPTNKTKCPSSDTVAIYGHHILSRFFHGLMDVAILNWRAEKRKTSPKKKGKMTFTFYNRT